MQYKLVHWIRLLCFQSDKFEAGGFRYTLRET